MKEFVLPSLGADMDEGMLAAWLVSPGDAIARGQVIAEVETDKGIIEVECWEDAVVVEFLREPSEERLPVGTPIALLKTADEAEAAPEAPFGVAPAETPATEPSPPREAEPPQVPDLAAHITPPVRHLAHQLGVDETAIHGSGQDGAITREDVRHAAGGNGEVRRHRPMVSPRARALATARGIDLDSVTATRSDGLIVADDLPEAVTAPDTTKKEPVDKAAAMRRAIARSMERSKREIPHYYLGMQIDMDKAMSWLDATNDERPITKRILPATLLLKASAVALKEFPDLNGHWVDGSFTPSEHVHLGVAVSLRGGGLVAPAIHDADELSLDDLMMALSDLVARARAGRLRGSEMSEQTCTVTNLGDRGVDSTFPVIIPPQVAIIGFGRVFDAPVAVDGDLAVHPVMQASLAADHRVTDGHTGGLLLLAIDRLLQEPEEL